MGQKLKVVEYNIHFITTADGRYLENIVLELNLENGWKFKMGGISYDVALEIRKYLSRPKPNEAFPPHLNDARFTLVDILLDIPELEKALHSSIKEIVIDYFDPEYNIYGASVYLNDNLTYRRGRILMIPSHAILLALIGNKEVYVSSDLVMDGEVLEEDTDIYLDDDEEEYMGK